MDSTLYPIHALMRSFTTWKDLLLSEHQRRQQAIFWVHWINDSGEETAY